MSSETTKFESVVLRSGAAADVGRRADMEDQHVAIDRIEGWGGALYAVFDGHRGKAAAKFASQNLSNLILHDLAFSWPMDRAMERAFLQVDEDFRQACLLDPSLHSGTTALAALIYQNKLVVANAGDSRAVLCRNGKAIQVSTDHKPDCDAEKTRVENLGYLNGLISVSRALGNWDLALKMLNGLGPLTSLPQLHHIDLTPDDQFVILACDGLWDVLSNQDAVDFARRKLQQHNHPQLCSKDLVSEALLRNSSDNITVLVVCFRSDPPPRRQFGNSMLNKRLVHCQL